MIVRPKDYNIVSFGSPNSNFVDITKMVGG